jgi:hypothetical protein
MLVTRVFRYSAFIVFVFCSALQVNGQFAKGQKFITGNLSFEVHDWSSEFSVGNNVTSSNINFQPALGFFLNDKIAVGGRVGYTFYRQKNVSNANPGFETISKSRSYSVGGFVNRYFTISEKFYFRMTCDVGYFRSFQESESAISYKMKSHGFGINVQPSFIFFPSPAWGIEAGLGNLGYNFSRGLSDDSKGSSFDFDYGVFSLGFGYYFNRNTE